MPESPTDLLLSTGLAAIPGSLWGMLAKLSWSDPDLVRPHVIPIGAELQSNAAVAGGLSSAGDPVPGDARVVAHRYFLVRRITGAVESDPTVVAELDNSFHVSFLIEDQERQYRLFREAIRMRSLAGNRAVPGVPMEFDEYPLVFLPNAQILVTFNPLAGLGRTASGVDAATTRRAQIEFHGALVAESIVDRLIELNAEALAKATLLRRGAEKR